MGHMKSIQLARETPREMARMRLFLDKRKAKAEQKKLARLKDGVRNEGDVILAAERDSAKKLHVDAARSWISVGMPNRALEEVKKSGYDIEVARLCAEYGLKDELNWMAHRLVQSGDMLASSNLYFAAGLQGEAVKFGLEHLAMVSPDLPRIFYENWEILKEMARKYEKEGDFGTAGRLYERINMHHEAATAYLRGGHFDDADRMLLAKKTGWFCNGLPLFAFKAAMDAGRLDLAEKWLSGHADAYQNDIIVEKSLKRIGYGGLAGALVGAAIVIPMAIIHAVSIPISIFFGIICTMFGAIIGLLSSDKYKSLGTEQLLGVVKEISASTAPFARQNPPELPPYPAVFMKEGKHSQANAVEDAGTKLFEEGKFYEAGLFHARSWRLPQAVACVRKLDESALLEEQAGNQEKAGALKAQAREIKVLLFGKGYLAAEELLNTSPEGAAAVLKLFGFAAPADEGKK